ncbi:MAG TPA: hypothetical protein DCO89_00715 [Clostridiales bacterium]|nr:hypothetical protein [Clostridiales bacterium]
MSFDFYIVAFSIISIAFAFIIFALAFSNYNKNVLKKSYMDTRIFIYTVMLAAIFFIGTIIYTNNVKSYNNITYLIYSLIFIAYSISIMIMLLLVLKPLMSIVYDTNLLAKGRKNLNIDFEGAIEFDDIAKNLEGIQKVFRDNDKKLNKKDVEYQKYIATNYLKFFGKTKPEELNVGDSVQVKLSTLFCDMRNSYFSSETLSLEDNFGLIKDFTHLVSNSVKQNDGFIDKFLGDGILAVFENEDDCLNAAIDIAKQLDYKNLVSVGKEPIKYGLALNSGMCVVGVVGSEKQKQFTVVSDVVNMTSRIETLNKIFSSRVLMTKNFMTNIKEPHSFRYIGTIEFDDLTSKIPLFESLDAYSDSKKNMLTKYVQEFESGVRFFEKGDYEKAKQFFGICVKKDNDNTLAKYYLNKTVTEMSKLLTNGEQSSI